MRHKLKYHDKHLKEAIDFGIEYMISAHPKDISEQGRKNVFEEFKKKLELKKQLNETHEL